MKYLRIKLTIFIGLFILTISICFAQNENNEEIILDELLLSNELPILLKNIPDSKLNKYGFYSKNEFTNIKFGSPLYIYTLSEDLIIDYKKNKRIKFEFDNEWFLPIFINYECLTFLFLQNKNTKQEVVGIGGSIVAEELNNCNAYDITNNKKNGLLFIYTLGAKFYVKKVKSEFQFYPIGQSCQNFQSTNRNFLTEEELFTHLLSLSN